MQKSVFDTAISILDDRGKPPNIAFARRCSIELGNVRGDFAAAENRDCWFRTPINEPSGKHKYRSDVHFSVGHFRKPIAQPRGVFLRLGEIALVDAPRILQCVVEDSDSCAVFTFRLSARLRFNGEDSVRTDHDMINVSDRPRFVGNQEIMEDPVTDEHQLIQRFADVALPLEA
jgi:hypothetical protein